MTRWLSHPCTPQEMSGFQPRFTPATRACPLSARSTRPHLHLRDRPERPERPGHRRPDRPRDQLAPVAAARRLRQDGSHRQPPIRVRPSCSRCRSEQHPLADDRLLRPGHPRADPTAGRVATDRRALGVRPPVHRLHRPGRRRRAQAPTPGRTRRAETPGRTSRVGPRPAGHAQQGRQRLAAAKVPTTAPSSRCSCDPRTVGSPS